jgi:hypothetical protein
LRGSFVVEPEPERAKKPVKASSAKPAGLASLIGPALRLVAASAAGRAVSDAKIAAVGASQRLALLAVAGLTGTVGLFCFSRAALELLERYVDTSSAWAIVGGFYAIVAGLFYFASTRRA